MRQKMLGNTCEECTLGCLLKTCRNMSILHVVQSWPRTCFRGECFVVLEKYTLCAVFLRICRHMSIMHVLSVGGMFLSIQLYLVYFVLNLGILIYTYRERHTHIYIERETKGYIQRYLYIYTKSETQCQHIVYYSSTVHTACKRSVKNRCMMWLGLCCVFVCLLFCCCCCCCCFCCCCLINRVA